MGAICFVIFELLKTRRVSMNIAPISAASLKCAGSSLMFVAMAVAVFLFPEIAYAAADPDKTLPYEEGIGIFARSMTGTIPFVISLVGIIACGAMLIFGGEISAFMRTMVFIILVVAVIVQATSVVEMLGGKKNLFSTGSRAVSAQSETRA
jgi:type IV secretion system protein TrbC